MPSEPESSSPTTEGLGFDGLGGQEKLMVKCLLVLIFNNLNTNIYTQICKLGAEKMKQQPWQNKFCNANIYSTTLNLFESANKSVALLKLCVQ